MMAAAIIVGLWLVAGLLLAYLYASAKMLKPDWHRLPALPGLPPDMEYQCWSSMPQFDPGQLSAALVQAIDVLTPVFGLSAIFSALKGARLLVYAANTYPGSGCGPAASNVVMLNARWAAVEGELNGVAHAVVHLVERHLGKPDYTHGSWGQRGIAQAIAAYEAKRRGQFA